jgi:parvulin-like peptidyl-prolyl isomerase
MSRGSRFSGTRNLRTTNFLLAITLCGSGFLGAFLYGQSAQPDASASPKELALQVIVVNTPEQASIVLERLKAGYDFAALAKEKSVDPTADSGGFMGAWTPPPYGLNCAKP